MVYSRSSWTFPSCCSSSSRWKIQSFKLQRVPSISNQLLVQVTTQQLIDGLKDFVPPQPYIEELLPFFSS
ncbi:MAG: hypothetical protein AAGF83_07455 [Cyanobacteria bacterium P01_G01_bin.67]